MDLKSISEIESKIISAITKEYRKFLFESNPSLKCGLNKEQAMRVLDIKSTKLDEMLKNNVLIEGTHYRKCGSKKLFHPNLADLYIKHGNTTHNNYLPTVNSSDENFTIIKSQKNKKLDPTT